MLTTEGIKKAVTRISGMKFFPSSDEDLRALLIEDMVNICESDAHAEWLAIRFSQVFRKAWPGLEELRAVYCSRFRPADGRNADSEAYPDGIPSERDTGIIEVKGLPALCAPLLMLEKKREDSRSLNLLGEFTAPALEELRQEESLAATPVYEAPPQPPRMKTPEELARLDALKLQIEELRTAELARRAAQQEYAGPQLAPGQSLSEFCDLYQKFS